MKILIVFLLFISLSCHKNDTKISITSPLVGKWGFYSDFTLPRVAEIKFKPDGTISAYHNGFPSAWFKFNKYSIVNDSTAMMETYSGSSKEEVKYKIYTIYLSLQYSDGGDTFIKRSE